MSIVSVQQRPPVWSPTYNPIIWKISSDQTTQYKFRYVFDVYIYGREMIRFKVPPNPAGAGLIDVSSLIAGEINIADNLPMLSTLPFYTGDLLASTVYILAGEEYSTTPTGTVTLYNGSGAPGEPAFGLYADPDFRPCPNSTTPVIAWASGQGANEYYDYQLTGGENILTYEMNLPNVDVDGKFLTRCPNNPQTIRSDEDFTLTWLNWNFETEQLHGEVPYTMRATYYDGATALGYQDFYNTPAEGGTGWATCSTWGGVTGDNYWLQSFKINPSDSLTSIRDQNDLFPNWGASGGSTYQPFPEIFTGFGFDSGLVPPVAFTTQIYDDQYIETTNCLEPPGVTGWSDLYYQPMDVPTGSVIDFVLLTGNAFGNSYPEMYLWGTTGDPSVPTGWVSLVVFTETNSSGNILYTVNNYTTTQNYTALGLRFYAANIADECGFYGPFSTPDSYVTIESSVTGLFDKFCLDLHKYSDYATCAVDPVPISETICLEINDDNCWGFEPIRFTWMNNLGGRDWFTFIKRNTFNQNASRTTLYKLPAYWSTATANVQDNSPARYGTTVFNVDLTNTWTASTDWLTEENSSWLRGMFASPHVLAYLPGRSQPTLVTITDGSYAVQTYAREKLFQYFVSFTEAQPDVVQGY